MQRSNVYCEWSPPCWQDVEPEVCAHLAKLGCPLLELGLPWIVNAFVGHLDAEQVLLLWDRVVGFDSLLPLPLLAVAVVCCRRHMILKTETKAELLSMMNDLSQLNAVALLQGILFGRS